MRSDTLKRQDKDIHIFNRHHARLNRTRAAKNISGYNFLFNLTAEILADRLADITRDFPLALQIGSRANPGYDKKITEAGQIDRLIKMDLVPSCDQRLDLIGDEESLPFKKDSFDAVICNLGLHSVNDLPGALIQINRALRPDGVYLGAMFGGGTLHELRDSFTAAEMKLKNGAGPHVLPFADKQQIGSLMQRAGFALPVIDSETIKVTYDNAFQLMKDLKAMGESNIVANRNKTLTGRELFMETARYYAENYPYDDKIEASFEIICMLGWAPHQSQQKPLKPGSAENRLADALGADEVNI